MECRSSSAKHQLHPVNTGASWQAALGGPTGQSSTLLQLDVPRSNAKDAVPLLRLRYACRNMHAVLASRQPFRVTGTRGKMWSACCYNYRLMLFAGLQTRGIYACYR